MESRLHKQTKARLIQATQGCREVSAPGARHETPVDAAPLTLQPSIHPEEGASGQPGPSDPQARRLGLGLGVQTQASPPGEKASFPASRFISLRCLSLQLSLLTPFTRN